MSVMTYKGYSALIEFDSEDLILVGRLAGIEDQISFHADDGKRLLYAFHEAVDDYLDTCAAMGKAPQKPYSGNLMLRVDPAVHARAAIAAKLSGRSLNAWGATAIKEAAERMLGEAA